MFGFSFSKILFTIFMVVAVFWIYRKINLIGEGRSKSRVRSGKASQNAGARATNPEVEDLTPCPTCGAYFASGSRHDCPERT